MRRDKKIEPSLVVTIALMASIIALSACQVTASDEPTLQVTQATSPSPPTNTHPPPTPTDTPIPSPSPTLPPPELLLTPTTTEIEVDYIPFRTSDDVLLMGKLFGEGEIAVILAHQGTIGANQRDWEEFAMLVAGRGFAAFSFDFRGYGRSRGDINQKTYLIRDMRAAIDQLHERGYDRIVCMGASMGGATCIKAATEFDLTGLVAIASPLSQGEPTHTKPEELAELSMPKLFLCTENDRYPGLTETLIDIYELSAEPKILKLFPGEVHGTEMFKQPYGDEFTAELVIFLERLR